MSTEMLQNPDDQPEVLRDDVYSEAYCAYMEAMAFRSIADLTSAEHVISNSTFPLADRFLKYTDALNSAILDPGTSDYSEVADSVLQDTIRSYVYSGVGINAPMIKFFAEFAGHDKIWLKNTVKPSVVMFQHLEANMVDFEHLLDLRHHGRQALLQLGLGSLTIRLSARMGHLSYGPVAGTE